MKGFAEPCLVVENARFTLYSAFDEAHGFKRVLLQVFEHAIAEELFDQVASFSGTAEIPLLYVNRERNYLVYEYPTLGLYRSYAEIRKQKELEFPYLRRYIADACNALREALQTHTYICLDYDAIFMGNIARSGAQDVHLQFVFDETVFSDQTVRDAFKSILFGGVVGGEDQKAESADAIVLELCDCFELRFTPEYEMWLTCTDKDVASDCALLLHTGEARGPGSLSRLERLISVCD